MRERQAAYNCIRVDRNISLDPSKDKINSLAHFHDLKIDYSSSEIPARSRDQLIEELEDLPYGVYLVRMRMPEDNHKLEAFGHSMVYVHEEDVSLYYDPNSGGIDLSNTPHRAKRMAEEFLGHWFGGEIRCHRMIAQTTAPRRKMIHTRLYG